MLAFYTKNKWKPTCLILFLYPIDKIPIILLWIRSAELNSVSIRVKSNCKKKWNEMNAAWNIDNGHLNVYFHISLA